MKKVLFLLLLFVSPAWADVQIRKEYHMQNKAPGRCAWCALETLGRTHGWSVLKGLVDKNNRSAFFSDMTRELDKYHVNYQVLEPKKKDFYFVMHRRPAEPNIHYVWAIKYSKAEADTVIKDETEVGEWWVETKAHYSINALKKSVDDGLGAAVCLEYNGADPLNKHNRHMVVVTDINDDWVFMVDSNLSPGIIRKMPIFDFLNRWNGSAIVIRKNK